MKNLLRKDYIQTIITSLVCVIAGLLIGLIVLIIIKPSAAFDGFGTMVLNFLKVDTKVEKLKKILQIKYLASVIIKTTPLILASLSILFAYKAGLFNIGCSGQYTLGILFALYSAVIFKLPWYLCLILAIIAGSIWGAISGFLKAFLNINEVISGIMLNWIGLYLTNAIIKSNANLWNDVKSETYSVVNESSKIPSCGLEKLFNNNQYINIGFIIAIVVAIILHFILSKTTFGYEIKATGANKDAAKYAGMKEKRNLVITLAISGALAGLSAALFYLTNIEPYYCPTSVPAMGFNGISAAFLGGLSPIGSIVSSLFITNLTEGGSRLSTAYYNPEIAQVISALIIYFCAFVFFMKEKLNKYFLKKDRENAKKNSEGGTK